jgi:hypothetical protein
MRSTRDNSAVPNPAACVCILYTYIYREGGRVRVCLCVHSSRQLFVCMSKYVQRSTAVTLEPIIQRRMRGRTILKTHLVGGVAQFNAAAFESVIAARGCC